MNTLKLVDIKQHEARPQEDVLVANLHRLLHSHNLTEAMLARLTKIPQPTLHKILSGKTEDPRISTLQSLANFFGVTIDELYSSSPYTEDKASVGIQSLPIVSWSECLKGREFIDTLTPNIWDHWLVIEYSGKDLYGLISKPSMEPRFPKGSTLIIDPQITPTDGDLVVVYYAGTQEATLRELSIDGPTKLLLPLNNLCSTHVLNDDIKIVGTVIQSRFNY
jgi:SOS-response transcriptional repressor LexA